MDSLLRWSIENSSPSTGPVQPQKDLDPAIIDHILGKPDAVLMKEALSVAVDEKKSEDERVNALDNLEMFIEHIDNANDLAKMQMWKPLHDLLTSPSSTSLIKTQTLWVIGTAVQNNPSAQHAYLEFEPMPTILSLLQPDNTSPQTRSKALYTLSGLLRHNAAAMASLGAANGWDVLKSALADSDIKVRRRTAFLINALLLPTHTSTDSSSTTQSVSTPSHALHTSTSPPLHSETNTNVNPVHPNSHASMVSDPHSASTRPLALKAMREDGVLDSVIEALLESVPFGADGEVEGDEEFEEHCIRILQTYAMSYNQPFTPSEKERLGGYLSEQGVKAEGGAGVSDEFQALREALKEPNE
jgi:hypothetical protein